MAGPLPLRNLPMLALRAVGRHKRAQSNVKPRFTACKGAV